LPLDPAKRALVDVNFEMTVGKLIIKRVEEIT
jgi:hypothetical protein